MFSELVEQWNVPQKSADLEKQLFKHKKKKKKEKMKQLKMKLSDKSLMENPSDTKFSGLMLKSFAELNDKQRRSNKKRKKQCKNKFKTEDKKTSNLEPTGKEVEDNSLKDKGSSKTKHKKLTEEEGSMRNGNEIMKKMKKKKSKIPNKSEKADKVPDNKSEQKSKSLDSIKVKVDKLKELEESKLEKKKALKRKAEDDREMSGLGAPKKCKSSNEISPETGEKSAGEVSHKTIRNREKNRRKRERKRALRKQLQAAARSGENVTESNVSIDAKTSAMDDKSEVKKKKKKRRKSSNEELIDQSTESKKKIEKKKKKSLSEVKIEKQIQEGRETQPSPEKNVTAKKQTPCGKKFNVAGLKKVLEGTPEGKTEPAREVGLRERMMNKLSSARFRFLNEKLYTSTGDEAFTMFREDPSSYMLYHDGYRRQVDKWPSNPCDVIIDIIKQMPQTAIVADFGCGEAKIAKSLANKVHSFDLKAACEGVIECNMTKVPLPSGSVDVAVYCLSLMGTDLVHYLMEGNRVMKTGGSLIIAEVKSRFQDVRHFIKGVEKLGFKLKSKDQSNTMFILLKFVKINNVDRSKPLPEIELLPCLYKKR